MPAKKAASKKSDAPASKVQLIVQPDDTIEPVLTALRSAKKLIHILIFRIDRKEIEKELVAAVERGVAVHALIAYTNRGGDKNLRQFELRLLGHGVTVTRTADDLVRYHGKMFVIDEKTLYLLAFNYTHMDIGLSRSFAAVTQDEKTVKEALRLFEADSHRLEYRCKNDSGLIVSPCNARERLHDFIAGAKKELLMYEMQVSDTEFLQLLQDKADEGVSVRIISRKAVKGSKLPTRSLPQRLHARAILRDGKQAFLGSMSLRKLELEARREIGIIFEDKTAVEKMTAVFEKDWEKSTPLVEHDAVESVLSITAKEVAKKLAKEIHIKPVVEKMLNDVFDEKADVSFEPEEVAETVRDAFRAEVREAVEEAMKDLVLEAAGHMQYEQKAAKK